MPRPNPHTKNSEKRQMRSAARLAAVQALYQMEIARDSMPKVRSEFETHRFGMEIDGEQMREADVELFRQILDDVVARQAAIDQMTGPRTGGSLAAGPHRQHPARSIPRILRRVAGSERRAAKSDYH